MTLDARIDSCLDELRNSLGSSAIITDSSLILEAESATFETAQRIPAILKPTNTQEVQHILQIANKHSTPIGGSDLEYPQNQNRFFLTYHY